MQTLLWICNVAWFARFALNVLISVTGQKSLIQVDVLDLWFLHS
jgi:hypothetical protein